MGTWITNEIKNAIVKKNHLFEKWILNPTETNREKYKTPPTSVTNLIEKEKRNDNFKKLGKKSTPKHDYETLKTNKNQAQNKYFP